MGFGSFDYNDITDAVALQKLTAAAAALPTSDMDLSTVAVRSSDVCLTVLGNDFSQ